MAGEIQVRSSLQITANDTDGAIAYIGPGQGGYNLDMAGRMGPTPGAIQVTTDGVDVDLSQLVVPGMIIMINYDKVNYVTVGILEATHNLFVPFAELPPADDTAGVKPVTLLLSRHLFQEYPGTGTPGAGTTNRLHAKATGVACKVFFGAFEA